MKIKIVFISILAAVSATFNFSSLKTNDAVPQGLTLEVVDVPNRRISGGSVAPKYGIPYQIGIISLQNGENRFCGGTLLSHKWVLTAAHCIFGCPGFIMLIGALELDKQEGDRIELEINITDAILHNEFDPVSLKNDIALIKLIDPVNYTQAIEPIKLPTLSDVDNTYEKGVVLVSGWGRLNDRESNLSTNLHYFKTRILNMDECRRLLKDYPDRDTNICIDASTKSTCKGDAGGPVAIFNLNRRRTLVGIISWGVSVGCEKGFPAVSTRITSYLNWISENTDIRIKDKF